MTTVGLGNRHQRRSNKCVALCGCECVAAGTGDPCLVHNEGSLAILYGRKSLPGCAGHSVRRRDERGQRSGAVCFAFAQTPQWPSGQCANSADARWRYAQCRELLLSCLTQLAEGSNLVQAVSVGCCRYFVALVVELEAMRTQQ